MEHDPLVYADVKAPAIVLAAVGTLAGPSKSSTGIQGVEGMGRRWCREWAVQTWGPVSVVLVCTIFKTLPEADSPEHINSDLHQQHCWYRSKLTIAAAEAYPVSLPLPYLQKPKLPSPLGFS